MKIMNQNPMKHPVNPVGDTGKVEVNRRAQSVCVCVYM